MGPPAQKRRIQPFLFFAVVVPHHPYPAHLLSIIDGPGTNYRLPGIPNATQSQILLDCVTEVYCNIFFAAKMISGKKTARLSGVVSFFSAAVQASHVPGSSFLEAHLPCGRWCLEGTVAVVFWLLPWRVAVQGLTPILVIARLGHDGFLEVGWAVLSSVALFRRSTFKEFPLVIRPAWT